MRYGHHAVLLACVMGVATLARPSAQSRSIDTILDALARVHTFGETAITADGRRVAWVEDDPAGGSGIYVRETGAVAPQRITAAGDGRLHDERGIAWSPDGHTLAFLSDAAGPPQLQLYVVDVASDAKPRRVTSLSGQVAHPLWSPDGTRVALLVVAGSTQRTGALVAYKPDAGVVGDVVEEQRVAIADLKGAVREVSPANLYVYDYDWSPDGRELAAEAVEGSGTNNYWIAQLYAIDAAGGPARAIWKPTLQIACPRWSPDGRSIALIQGLMSDEGATGGDVYLIPAAGGTARNITPKIDGSVRWLAWEGDGRLLLSEYTDGRSALALTSADGRARKIAWSAPEFVSAVSASRQGGLVAAVVQSFAQAPEVYAGPIGSWTPQTTTNVSVQPTWGEAKSLRWTSDAADPAGVRPRVQGFLVYPANFDSARRYPLVVSVHGGPAAANFPSWPSRWNAVLPSEGYFLLLPNPRGSYGAGEAFTQANVKDFGYGDLHDILTGVDAAVKAAPIDPRRVGIVGWSYGGYMSMWAVTQTNRFAAAVAGAGIANWQSYYGENRIDQWMLPFFGASVYDDPEVYARSSPITYIKQAKTPTLVLHGDRDSEVPTPQGYEFWHALKALGVPTQLVIYPDEGHGISKPEHVRDIEERIVAWFDRYLTR